MGEVRPATPRNSFQSRIKPPRSRSRTARMRAVRLAGGGIRLAERDRQHGGSGVVEIQFPLSRCRLLLRESFSDDCPAICSSVCSSAIWVPMMNSSVPCVS